MEKIQLEMPRRELYRWAQKKLKFRIYAIIEVAMIVLLIWIVICLSYGSSIFVPATFISLLFVLHFFSEIFWLKLFIILIVAL